MARVDLAGRVIVITGASGGIGRATAIACARAGMAVVLNGRDEDRLGEATEAVEAVGARAAAVRGDAAAGDVQTEMLARGGDLGPVYGVFANAGYGHEVETLEMSDADVRRMFEVNFFAALDLVRSAAPAMLERGEGHLLMCSSCLSKIGLPMYACYGATKAAQDHFCRAMRHELGPRGVAVSSVHPVGTKTAFFETMGEKSGGLRLMDRSTQAFMQPPERVARAIVRTLRRGTGREVWTSIGARTAFGLSVMLPNATDFVLSKMVARRIGKTGG
jgi:short-subunit dehydrogenase